MWPGVREMKWARGSDWCYKKMKQCGLMGGCLRSSVNESPMGSPIVEATVWLSVWGSSINAREMVKYHSRRWERWGRARGYAVSGQSSGSGVACAVAQVEPCLWPPDEGARGAEIQPTLPIRPPTRERAVHMPGEGCLTQTLHRGPLWAGTAPAPSHCPLPRPVGTCVRVFSCEATLGFLVVRFVWRRLISSSGKMRKGKRDPSPPHLLKNMKAACTEHVWRPWLRKGRGGELVTRDSTEDTVRPRDRNSSHCPMMPTFVHCLCWVLFT